MIQQFTQKLTIIQKFSSFRKYQNKSFFMDWINELILKTYLKCYCDLSVSIVSFIPLSTINTCSSNCYSGTYNTHGNTCKSTDVDVNFFVNVRTE